jgi:hypothetical protein
MNRPYVTPAHQDFMSSVEHGIGLRRILARLDLIGPLTGPAPAALAQVLTTA